MSSLVGIKIITSACVAALVFAAGCSSGVEDSVPEEDVLLMAGDSVLTLRAVEQKIPVGIDPADSVALFHAIVDEWIKSRVLTRLAESKLPDVSEIDRKVKAYRNRLIVAEYLAMMRQSQSAKVSEDSVRAFYESHKKDLLTETPLVRGIYMKVPENVSGLPEIRRLVFSGDDGSVDRLEKEWVGDAVQYDYFNATWVDWPTVADQIPYRFYDPDAFLSATSNFETTYRGSVYLLHVSDYLPSGSQQPYEFASKWIADMMEKAKINSYEKSLVRSLVSKSVRDGELVAVGYDPLLRCLVKGMKKNENKNHEDEKE